MAAEQKFTRKLSAILSADVKGYSSLMTDDEAHTIKTLKEYRKIMSENIQLHSGYVVDNPGDNLLAQFSSAVDAVECAVQVQKKLKKENNRFVENKQMKFRIGVNIGDVVLDEGRIYGSSVNIAARIEGIAEPGGICISRNTYDHVKGKLELEFEFLGEHEVKNIKEPVRIYKVLLDSNRSKPLVKEYFELPDKPSLAVLPFDNLSGDPSQDYFSDGLTEQIINGLCKISNLFVIARNSSFAYKGKSVSTVQIAKELGVKYILEGSVQKAGGQVRITAQLIDAATDFHMWSEHYDRDLSDIFALQDEITMEVVSAMAINLTEGEQARLWIEGQTTNIKAFDNYMRGNECLVRNNKEDNIQAQQFYNKSISFDKNWVEPYIKLGTMHCLDWMLGWSDSPLQSFEEAEKNANKAFALNDSHDQVHSLLGFICLLKRQFDLAIKEGKLAVSLNPNGAEAHFSLGCVFCFSNEIDLAIKLLKRAFRLNPIPPSHYYHILGTAYQINGEYEKAIGLAKEALKISPDQVETYLLLVVAYSLSNRAEKAREAAEEVLRINPDLSVDYFTKMLPYKHQETVDKIAFALCKAGLPN
jgi:adenylate cyclase